MRYLVVLSEREDVGPPPAELVTAMGAARREAFASGMAVDAGALDGEPRTTFTVRSGSLSRSDGPGARPGEVVGEYAVLDVRSHEEAVEGARRLVQLHLDHWPGWEGTAEVRRVSEPA